MFHVQHNISTKNVKFLLVDEADLFLGHPKAAKAYDCYVRPIAESVVSRVMCMLSTLQGAGTERCRLIFLTNSFKCWETVAASLKPLKVTCYSVGVATLPTTVRTSIKEVVRKGGVCGFTTGKVTVDYTERYAKMFP